MKVVVVVPWRPAPGRWRPYAEVREWYAEHFPDWLVLTSHGGHGGEFNLARARNEGVWKASAVNAEVVVINDADTIAEPAQLEQAANRAFLTDSVWLPYTEYRSLMDEGTWQHRRGHPLEVCSYFHVEAATSGVYVTTPRAWWATNGQDEKFLGWAPEDMAWLVTYRLVFNAEPGRIDGRVYGLGHPQASKEGPRYEAALDRYRRYLDAAERGDVQTCLDLAGGAE